MGERELDAELVGRARSGDRRAFDLLVLKYQHKVVNLVTRYVHDSSEALDVAQEAFFKAYRALDKFRGDSAFYTWMYRIAVNTAKNYLAAESRRPSVDGVDPAWDGQHASEIEMPVVDTPERELLRDEIEQTIFRAIEALPDELRMAITLRELEGLSYEDIAQVMDCPVGTVRSRIFRAREAIDRVLKPLVE